MEIFCGKCGGVFDSAPEFAAHGCAIAPAAGTVPATADQQTNAATDG